MPPGAAFCPVFGGAFTVRFVTFSASSQSCLGQTLTGFLSPQTLNDVPGPVVPPRTVKARQKRGKSRHPAALDGRNWH